MLHEKAHWQSHTSLTTTHSNKTSDRNDEKMCSVTPKSECPDKPIRLSRYTGSETWQNIEGPVVSLERTLYGHPLADLLWLYLIENVLVQNGLDWKNAMIDVENQMSSVFFFFLEARLIFFWIGFDWDENASVRYQMKSSFELWRFVQMINCTVLRWGRDTKDRDKLTNLIIDIFYNLFRMMIFKKETPTQL